MLYFKVSPLKIDAKPTKLTTHQPRNGQAKRYIGNQVNKKPQLGGIFDQCKSHSLQVLHKSQGRCSDRDQALCK